MNTRYAGVTILVLMFLTVIATSTYVIFEYDDSDVKVPSLYKTFRVDNIISSSNEEKSNTIQELSSDYTENEKKVRVVEEVIERVVKKEKEMIPFAGENICFDAENSNISIDICPEYILGGNGFGSDYENTSGADSEFFSVFSNQTGMIIADDMMVLQNFTASSSSSGNPIGHDSETMLKNSQIEVRKRIILEPYETDYFQIKYTVKNIASPYFREQNYFETANKILKEKGRSGISPALADLDADGDLDLAVCQDSALDYLENQGNNTDPDFVLVDDRQVLTDSNLFQGFFSGGAPQFADIDNDGDYDLFFGMDSGDDIDFYENIGSSLVPSFIEANNTIIDTINTYNNGLGASQIYSAFQILDYDNDGDLDMILSDNLDDSFAYFENTGTVSSPSWNHVNLNVPAIDGMPIFVKYDGDNVYDLFGGYDLSNSYVQRFYENTGSALSPAWTKNDDFFISHYREGDYNGGYVIDIDNDGDEDIVIPSDDTLYLYTRGKTETLRDVRVGEYIEYGIATMSEDGQAVYNASEDMVIINPVISQPHRGTYMYADKQSVSHGLTNDSVYVDTYNAAYNREFLNGDDYFSGDYYILNGAVAAGMEYGLGDIAPGQEESVTITFKFGNIAGRGNADLAISDVQFLEGNNISVNMVNLGNNTASDFRILFAEMDDNDVVKAKEEAFNETLKAGESAVYSTIWSVKKGNTLMVVADPGNDVYEADESNNKAEKIKYNKDVYVVSDVEPSILNPLFEQYVKEKLAGVNIVDNSADADYIVYIGDNPYNSQTLSDGWGYTEGLIKRGWSKGRSPYNALVDVFRDNGKTMVMIEGVAIDGIVAAMKRADYSALENNGDFVKKEDADGIEVFEWFRLAANKIYLYQNNAQFYDIVSDALYGKYSEEDKLVKTTGGTMLRLKNLGTYKSAELREYEGLPDYPVVMAGGLWSDITTWDELGRELADSGRDVWLAEITGGPYTEVDGYDYTYNQVVSEHVPAIVGGVVQFTGKPQIQYVGHSNGGRSMLDTLSAYSSTGMANSGWYCNSTTCPQGSDPNWIQSSFGANPVETYVGAGVPGAFEGSSISKNYIVGFGWDSIQKLENRGEHHITPVDIITTGTPVEDMFTSDEESNEISLTLFKQYYNWINSTDDTQPASGLVLDNFAIIGGNFCGDDDCVVTLNDQDAIYENINLSSPNGTNTLSKEYFNIHRYHSGMSEDPRIMSITTKKLNKESFSFWQTNVQLQKQQILS